MEYQDNFIDASLQSGDWEPQPTVTRDLARQAKVQGQSLPRSGPTGWLAGSPWLGRALKGLCVDLGVDRRGGRLKLYILCKV